MLSSFRKGYKMDLSNDVILTVYVPTYNHENYITKALDSILMQKTKYNFEVLVGEDCSTDSTRAVLKDYESKHPGKFNIFYREKNMYGSSPNNALDLKLRSRGKYIICLEGDDFWTDEFKLEKQINFLETHPEYYAVAHNCTVVGEDSLPNGETYPECKDSEYSYKHFFSEIMPGQLATLMYRNYFKDETFDESLFGKGLIPGDRLLYFSFLCHSKVYCMQETMSAYRHITTHGSSFSATNKFNYLKQKRWHQELMKYAAEHSTKYAVIYTEYQYFYIILKALFLKHISLKQALCDYAEIKHKASVLFIGLKRIINKKILKKKLYA